MIIEGQVQIPDAEIDFSFVRSSGPGGQNVNKVNSKAVLRWSFGLNQSLAPAVRARFRARYANQITVNDEVVLTSDRFRDQARNSQDCRDKLRKMILAVLHPPKKRVATKPTTNQRAKRLDVKKMHGAKKNQRRKVFFD